MAVLKKFRPKWWPNNRRSPVARTHTNIALVPPVDARYDLRPLSVAQIDECWLLDQRCFVDGEAYSRDTFEYLLTARRLASSLMERVEEGFLRREARIVRLEVRAANLSAQKLYSSLGYTVTQRLPRYYSNGGDGLLMVKPLA